MRRPKEHVMETKSIKILENQIPDEWISRKIDQDYALDREIEIVSEEEVSGKSLLVQLRSSEFFVPKGPFIHYSFETKKLRYYLEKDIPVLLVLVDLRKEQCYWLFTQEYVYEQLENDNALWRQQKTITLKIPVDNILSESLDRLDEIAFQGPFYLFMKKITSIPAEAMLSWKKDLEAIRALEDFEERMASKEHEIGLELAYRYGKEGKDEQSLEKLWNVYVRSGTVDPLNRIKAIGALLWHYNLSNLKENKEAFNLTLEGLKLAEEIGNKPYSLYLRGIVIQAVYFKLVLDWTNQMLLQKVSQQYEGSLMAPFMGIHVHETGQKLLKIKFDYISNLSEAEAKKQYYVFSDLLRRLALMQLFLYQYMIIWVDSKEITGLLFSAEGLLDFSLKIADSLNREEMKCIILEDMAMLYHFKNDVEKRREVLRRCLEIATEIKHKGLAKEAREKYKLYEKSGRFRTGPRDIGRITEEEFEKLPDDEIDRAHRFLLKIAGIDINGNDELAEIARVGLRDRNPERVLKYCRHLFVEITSYGPIWEMVGLHSTGRKLLFCEKKGGLEGWKLDEIFEEFKRSNCKNCKFHSPRPKDWKWTYRWQRERVKPEGMKRFLKAIHQM